MLRVADGREVAVLRGHSQRVAHVASSPTRGLLTAGAELGRLGASAEALQQAVMTGWGRSAEEVSARATAPWPGAPRRWRL